MNVEALDHGSRVRGELVATPFPGEVTASANPVLVSCRALEGEAVIDSRGNDVGRISRLVIDTASGRVAQAVVACGGVLGIGERLCAVPWMRLAPDLQRRCFVLDADLAQCDPRDLDDGAVATVPSM